MKLFIFYLVLFGVTLSVGARNNGTYKLELVQVLFRHGDRTPEKYEVYPTDPYEPHEYEKIGYGQLTQIGLKRMQTLGRNLKRKYHKFLGDYRFNKLYGYSTGKDRTKLSLQAVLSGLYPPPSTCSNDTIVTRLIPTFYAKPANNFLTRYYSRVRCPRYFEIVDEAEKQPDLISRFEKYAKFREYVKNSTGISIHNMQLAWKVYNNIIAVRRMGLPNPKWMSDSDFEKLEELNTLGWDLECYFESGRKLNSGSIIKTMLKNIQYNEEKKDNGRKMYLLSGHDFNIASFIRAHKFTEPPGSPGYGSGIIIEKLRRNLDGKIFLRFYFLSGEDKEWITALKFKDFGNHVPLDEYQKEIASLLPEEDDSCGIMLDVNTDN